MLKYLLFISVIFHCFLASSQESGRKEIKKWIKHTYTKMNRPLTPEGYSQSYDCQKFPVFKRKIEDTVSIYHLFRIDTVEFRDSGNIEIFNQPYTITYPVKILSRSRLILASLKYDEFVLREDTLIMRENIEMINPRNLNRTMNNFFRWALKEDSDSASNKSISNIDVHYKVIYYKGMFSEMKFKRIPEKINYRNERISLMLNWEQDDMQCFEIKLESIPRENYVFNEKFEFLEYEDCNIKDKRFEK